MKKSRLIDMPEIFKRSEWKYALMESPILKEKLKRVYDFITYEKIIKDRIEHMSKFASTLEKEEINMKAEFNKAMDKIIPNYHIDVKVYNNNVYLNSKQRKVTYKLLKKKLFSWRGMWSDKEVFFYNIDKMKLKLLNHYTLNMSRPILVPILDMDHYIPNFTKYDKTQLFNNNDKNINYKINLNIENILRKGNEEEKDLDQRTQDYTSCNFLFDIYRLNTFMWNIYTDINSIADLSKDSVYYDILSNFILKEDKKTYYVCCFVKLSHHIKGLFYLNKEGLTFKVFMKQKNEDRRFLRTNSVQLVDRHDEDFDPDRGTCYGSYFIKHDKDFDHISFNFPYNEIKYLFKRRYYYKKSAIEIFTTTNKSYYFNFKNQSDRDMIIKGILSQLEYKRDIKLDSKDNYKDKDDLTIGYENLFQLKKNLKSDYLSYKIDNWVNRKISNFEMIMWLNIFANRSFNDISQYPVFPWILKNYIGNDINLDNDLREFDLPMGMMEIDEKGKGKERKMLYLEAYRTLQVEITNGMSTDIPYLYGSHYSNPIYIAHYLTRLFPFSHIMIELQGDKFDDPNRLFISIANSFYCATTQKGDIRELIAEFYYLPEMFMNINNLNMGIRTDANMNKLIVNNVELPQWANNDPFEFIIKMKEYLESDEVSANLSDWLDLIFGYKQKGKEGENSLNLFIPSSYEDSINIENVSKDQIAYYMRMVEFGLTPLQLTTRPFSVKFHKDIVRKGRQITESKELRPYGNFSAQKKNKDKVTMIKLKVLDNDKVLCIYDNNTFNICKFIQNDYKYNIDVYVSKVYNSIENQFKIKNRINEPLETNSPILIYNKGKV